MKSQITAVNIIKKAIYLIAMVVIVILLVQGAAKAYDFGHAVFMDESMTSKEDARDVTITIAEGDSVLDIGNMLERRGLIQDAYVFLGAVILLRSRKKACAGQL